MNEIQKEILRLQELTKRYKRQLRKYFQEEPTLEYDELLKVSNSLNEDNDCAVIAISAATGKDYKTVRDELKKLGRNHGEATETILIRRVLNKFGFDLFPKIVSAKTIRTLERELSKNPGTYLVFTQGHVLTVVNGKAQDWTSGRLNRVQMIFEVL